MKQFQELEERFSKEGLRELALIDMRAAEIIDRLWKITTIGVNLQKLEAVGVDEFTRRFMPHIDSLFAEFDKVIQDFQAKRGEI